MGFALSGCRTHPSAEPSTGVAPFHGPEVLEDILVVVFFNILGGRPVMRFRPPSSAEVGSRPG